MEEASERSVFRTVWLLLFGLLAVTGCAILALVLSASPASAAENPGESAPIASLPASPLSAVELPSPPISVPPISVPPISVPAISVRPIVDPAIAQLEAQLSDRVGAATAPLRQVGAAVLPKTTQVVTESLEKLGGGLAATVSGIVDVLPTLEVAPVLDGLEPHAESASLGASVASIDRAWAPLQVSLLRATPAALAAPTITVPEPAAPVNGAPVASPATSPGPTGTDSSASAAMAATIDEGWSVTLASGRTTTQADSAHGSPTFGFDSTPD